MSKNELLSELKKNTRLRVGLWLIIAIIGFYSLLLLNDYAVALQGQYQSKVTHLARLQDVTSQDEWIQRAEHAKSAKITLENKLWTAASKGLAQADFQAWLDGQIKAAKIQKTKMIVEEAKDAPRQNNIWLVTAKLDGIFEATALERLLLNFSQHSQWVVIDSFEVRQSNRSPRFTLLMSVYFQATAT
ncbi:hypothetical protein [Candidatus Albibeggiatoa sp. nov. NOAA]|uniref:hypothetical protein n=1 Tax=Candidatus Albibeggiatoa sp. nov. NOAA TaxID=3162724 RepID=UPI0032F2DB0F|nr:hypothetical protein [Thiotrichaceae bacterium]